jgi:hypothetical protein
MTRIGLGVVLAALALACATTAPRAPDGRVFTYNVSLDGKYVEPGHWAGSWANRGVCLDNVGQTDEEAGVLASSGTFDGVWASKTEMKSCTTTGKATCTFGDGSSHTEEWTAQCKRGPDGFLIFEGRSVLVSGTGRFEGIQGTISWTHRNMTKPPNEIGFQVNTSNFTLPKK